MDIAYDNLFGAVSSEILYKQYNNRLTAYIPNN